MKTNIKRAILSLALLGLAIWQPGQTRAETSTRAYLTARTTGTSAVFALNTTDVVGLTVAWSTGVTVGQVVLETAPTATYSGDWTNAITLDAPATVPSVTADAVQIAAAFGRVRISTTITGGTVTAYVHQQPGAGR
jgi:hypothetical protein